MVKVCDFIMKVIFVGFVGQNLWVTVVVMLDFSDIVWGLVDWTDEHNNGILKCDRNVVEIRLKNLDSIYS